MKYDEGSSMKWEQNKYLLRQEHPPLSPSTPSLLYQLKVLCLEKIGRNIILMTSLHRKMKNTYILTFQK